MLSPESVWPMAYLMEKSRAICSNSLRPPIKRLFAATSAAAPLSAATVTAKNSLSAGRPLAGSIKWCQNVS